MLRKWHYKEASIEELMEVSGIYEDLAYRLKEEL